MIEVGRALVQMRKDHPWLREIAGGRDVNFVSDVDFTAAETPLPRSILSVRVEGSDTTALVPFTADEAVEVAENGTYTALEIATRLHAQLRGTVWFGENAAIQEHVLDGVESDTAEGARTRIVLRWRGKASWRTR